MANKDKVRKSALTRYRRFVDILNASELTLVHQEPGEDHCCEDVVEANKRKRSLAKEMAIACIDAEISGHSTIQMILHSGKIAELSAEREVLKVLLN